MDLPECVSAEGFTKFSLREGRRPCDGSACGAQRAALAASVHLQFSGWSPLTGIYTEAGGLDLLFFKINESSL